MASNPRPNKAFSRILRHRVTPHNILRPSTSVDSVGEVTETTSQHEENVYVYQPNKGNSIVSEGKIEDIDMNGICEPNAQIQEGDIIEHGPAKYEVETKVGRPNEQDTEYYVLGLSNVQT
jgi:hypothetical protein